MSNLNNIGFKNNFSGIDLIINLWKYKKNFLYVLIPLLIFSITIESILAKKDIIRVKLIDPDQIHHKIYPVESDLFVSGLGVDDVKFIKSSSSFGRSLKVDLDFYSQYFEPTLLSKKNLSNFASINNAKYNLSEYLEQNNIYVRKENEKNKFYIVIPKGNKNENFFIEYIEHTAGVAYNEFHKHVGNIEHKKLSILERDIKMLNQIYFKNIENYKERESVFVINLPIIIDIYENRKIIIEENIAFLQRFANNNPYNEEWIFDGPSKEIVNQKFYTIAKFILPVILSLIIYLIYVLIKLIKKDAQN